MSDTAPQLAHLAARTGTLRVLRTQSAYERILKRPLDVLIAIVAGLIMLPVILMISFIVRVGLGPGVLYGQERVGLHGRRFTIWKFRTMRPDRRREQVATVTEDRRLDHKDDNDPRHTGLGRMLRKLSLDELPQLWNVLKGDMSIVGPRPELYTIAAERGYLDHVRHEVRPGLTGPYQTSKLRQNADLRDGLAMDAAYVADLNFRNDLRYMIRTLGTLVGIGATGT